MIARFSSGEVLLTARIAQVVVEIRLVVMPWHSLFADNWRVYDNAGPKPRLIAFGRRMTKERIKDDEAWQRFLAGSAGADDSDDR